MPVVKQTYLVSFQEPAMLMKDFFRRYHRFTKEELETTSGLILKVVDYPVKLYMELLCQAIFNTPASRHGGADYDVLQAEKLLIKDGMQPQKVAECTRRVFEMCVDILGNNFPMLSFMEETKVDFQMVNEFDLLVVVPVNTDDLLS